MKVCSAIPGLRLVALVLLSVSSLCIAQRHAFGETCGFGCSLASVDRKYGTTIVFTIKQSGALARETKNPALLLYGWGEYAAENGAEIYGEVHRGATFKFAVAKQLSKAGPLFVLDRVKAVTWAEEGLSTTAQLARYGHGQIMDRVWGELIDMSFGQSEAKKCVSTNLNPDLDDCSGEMPEKSKSGDGWRMVGMYQVANGQAAYQAVDSPCQPNDANGKNAQLTSVFDLSQFPGIKILQDDTTSRGRSVTFLTRGVRNSRPDDYLDRMELTYTSSSQAELTSYDDFDVKGQLQLKTKSVFEQCQYQEPDCSPSGIQAWKAQHGADAVYYECEQAAQ